MADEPALLKLLLAKAAVDVAVFVDEDSPFFGDEWVDDSAFVSEFLEMSCLELKRKIVLICDQGTIMCQFS